MTDGLIEGDVASQYLGLSAAQRNGFENERRADLRRLSYSRDKELGSADFVSQIDFRIADSILAPLDLTTKNKEFANLLARVFAGLLTEQKISGTVRNPELEFSDEIVFGNVARMNNIPRDFIDSLPANVKSRLRSLV